MKREVPRSLPFPADRHRTIRATKCKRQQEEEEERGRERSSRTSLCSRGKGTERKGRHGGGLKQLTVRNNSFGPRKKWFSYKSCPKEKRSSGFNTLKKDIHAFLKLGLSFNIELLQCQQSWKWKNWQWILGLCSNFWLVVYIVNRDTSFRQMWNAMSQVLFQRWCTIQECDWWKYFGEEVQFDKKGKKRKRFSR